MNGMVIKGTLDRQWKISTTLSIIMQYVVISFVYVREIFLFFKLDRAASLLFVGIFASFAYFLLISLFSVITSGFSLNQLYAVMIGIVLIILIIFFAFEVVGSGFITEAEKTISHVLLLLYLLGLNKIKSSRGLFRYICIFNAVLSIIQIAMAFLPGSYADGKLTYFYCNPNECGLSLYLTGIYLFIYLIYRREQKLRYGPVLLLLLCEIMLCHLTGSRTALIALVTPFILFFILGKKNKPGMLSKWVTSAIVLSSMFPLIWLMIYNLFPDKGVFIFGKPIFSGREAIWGSIVNTILKNPLKSHYNELIAYSSSGYRQLCSHEYGTHNAFWSVLWNYNIVSLILFLWLINRTIKKVIAGIDSAFKMAILMAIISLFFEMAFETALLSSGFNYAFRAFYLLALIGTC